MDTLLVSPLAPSILLIAGALLLLLLDTLGSSPLAALSWLRHERLLSILSLLTLIGLAYLVNRLPHGVERSVYTWRWTLPGGLSATLSWQVDDWGWLMGMLATLLAAAAALLTWSRRGWRTAATQASILMILACLWTIALAVNLLTLGLAWSGLAASLTASRLLFTPSGSLLEGIEPPRFYTWRSIVKTWSSLQAWANRSGEQIATQIALAPLELLAIVISISIVWNAAQPSWQVTTLPTTSAILLTVAALWRIGAYPLHFWITGSTEPEEGGRLTTHLLPAVAGLLLLGRLQSAGAVAWLSGPTPLTLLLLAAFGSAVAAWLSPQRDQAMAYVGASLGSWTVLAMGLTQGASLAWPAIAFALSLAGLTVAWALRREWGWRLPLVLALITVLGMPGTPGLPYLVIATQAAPDSTALIVWTMSMLTETLLVAAALRGWRRREPSSPVGLDTAVVSVLAFVLLIIVPLTWGGQTPLELLHLSKPEGAWAALLQEAPPLLWLSLLLPPLFGGMLVWRRPHIFAGTERWLPTMGAFTGLDWIQTGLLWSGRGLAAGFRGMAAIVEGEGYVGWLILVALLGWILLRA